MPTAGRPAPTCTSALDRQDPVLRTDQVPDFVKALSLVSGRIDRMWSIDGDQYAEEVVLRAPDPQDPEVIRRRHVEHLAFTQRVADNLAEVIRLLAQAASTDEALNDLAALLEVEEVEVMYRLASFDMLSLTRAAYERRLQLLADLEA
jgi:hypothetical protein